MKVFFDHAIFTLQRYGGISKYIVNLVENFSKDIDPSIISLFYKNHYLKDCKYSNKLIFYNKAGPFVKVINQINKFYFEYKIKSVNPDLIHLTYFNEKKFYKFNSKIVMTEYDLIKEKFYPKKFNSQIEFKKKLFNKVDHIICISENTKKDLQQFYSIDSSKISVIHLAVNNSKEFRKKDLNLRPFILFVGERSRYKNFENAIKAYASSNKIHSDFDFICFGGGKFSKVEEDFLKSLPISRNKIYQFEGDEYDLNFFYQKARVFIFPSLYEGFGLPILEAMNMNCPVICSDTSCFPEIAKNAVSFFDPSSIDSIKSNLEKLIFNDQLLIDLKKRGTDNLNNFSWKKCANETEKIYKNLV
tara:strand:- start:12 stop:1088 length:1077 start_codon:yes stop_codon:yes gene_type:complete